MLFLRTKGLFWYWVYDGKGVAERKASLFTVIHLKDEKLFNASTPRDFNLFLSPGQEVAALKSRSRGGVSSA